MRVTVIHNEEAGGSEPSTEALIGAIREAGHEPRYFSSRPDDVARALELPGDLVAVAGGDGTVVDVAGRLAGRGVPIAAIPAGTANNIATALGVGDTWRSAIAAWAGSSTRPVDIGWASGASGAAPFIESVGCGLIVDLIIHFDSDDSQPEPQSTDEEVDQARQKFRELLRNSRPRRWRVELDGQDASGLYLMVEAMNMGRAGPGLVLAPNADISDGLLDVVLMTEADRPAVDAYLQKVAWDNAAPPKLTVRRARQVVIDPGQDLLHVGGEPWSGRKPPQGPLGPVCIRLQEKALLFLVPKMPP